MTLNHYRFADLSLVPVAALAGVASVNTDPLHSGLAVGVFAAFVGFLVWGFFQGFYARWRVLGPLFTYVGLVYAATTEPTED